MRLTDIILLIGADNLLDEVVADDVFFAELGNANALDFTADFERFDETGLFALRQIDLGDIAGDNGLGVETEARQEHLHLLAGGVLGFVQNHEGIVERAAAHESERSNFDDALFEEAIEFVGLEHVVERVVKRAHVRIDFFLQRAGKKSKALAGFNRGPSENDAIDALGEQRADRHGDSYIRFTGATWANPKHHVVLFNLFHVVALAVVLRRDDFFAEGTLAAMLERAARRFMRISGRDVNQRIYFGARELPSMAGKMVVLFHDFHGVINVVLLAFDGQAIVVEVRADVEGVFEQ